MEPCPFCGGEAKLTQFVSPKNFYYVECKNCHCKTDGYRCDINGTNEQNKAAQVEIWNRRQNRG